MTSARTFASLVVVEFRWFLLSALAVFATVNGILVVRGFVVFELTGSFAALGSVALAGVVPGILGTIYGGVVADRWPKHRVIQLGQLVVAALAFGVGLLIYLDRLELWHLVVAAGAQGGIFGVIAPSWNAIIPEIVGRERIMNATALQMGGTNVIRLTVPAGFGYLLSFLGPEYAYALIGTLALFAVAGLTRVRSTSACRPADSAVGTPPSGPQALLEGLRYVVRRPEIWGLLVANILLTLLSMPFLHMLPGYVKQVFKGGPDLLGNMVSLVSVGALACTLVVASMSGRHRGRLMLWAGAGMGAMLVAFATAEAVWTALPFLLLIGAGQALRNSLAHVLCQIHVSDAYRGRVMSLLAMQMNAAQLGTFLIGLASEAIGPRWAMGAMGAVLVTTSVCFYQLLPAVRRLE